VEQLLRTRFIEAGLNTTDEIIAKLVVYAQMIHTDNQSYNLTGLKSAEDILNVLIVNSALPVKNLRVPRGTRFVDIGTGSGIPGIIIATLYPEVEAVLIDANSKKTEFLKKVCSVLGLDNVKIVYGRIEELGRDKELRASFDWSFTRAFGPLYYSIEFALPLLKKEGALYVYSNLLTEKISADMKQHIKNLGGKLLPVPEHSACGLIDEGILIRKTALTSGGYPRRFPIVKRESAKVAEEEAGE
jgi:16S rRNA (guanine527-N7)-methyltransferase